MTTPTITTQEVTAPKVNVTTTTIPATQNPKPTSQMKYVATKTQEAKTTVMTGVTTHSFIKAKKNQMVAVCQVFDAMSGQLLRFDK